MFKWKFVSFRTEIRVKQGNCYNIVLRASGSGEINAWRSPRRRFRLENTSDQLLTSLSIEWQSLAKLWAAWIANGSRLVQWMLASNFKPGALAPQVARSFA